MLIFVDEDIPGGRETFSRLGRVATFSGRAIRSAAFADADALVVRSVTRVDAALLAGSRVRFVGTVTTGMDHLDTSWLLSRGITVASAAGCNSVPVAEYVLAALLALARRRQFDLGARVLGVIGVGRIGSIIARWAQALGMQVLRCDPPLQRLHAAASPQPSSSPVDYVPFEHLAGAADIVTLHVPLTHEGADRTCGMVDTKWLAALKTGAILINTSRGDVVREDHLLASIDAGRLAAVVLDVWRNEPAIDPELVRRVDIATPHVAGYSVESRQRAVTMIFDALARFAAGAGSLPADRRQPSDLRPLGMHGGGNAISDITVAAGGPWRLAVTDVVLRACDIEAVDVRLRGAAGIAAFDEIRRACAGRREFGAHRPVGLAAAHPARRFLHEVGFAG
ncbi:MAG TPA: 4-phosphoerythronate dehydrogenase [Phycisphaerae bacterium]|nr:4-phosphoerythronate dehydrogenase [Phycisphaerae bacterium]